MHISNQPDASLQVLRNKKFVLGRRDRQEIRRCVSGTKFWLLIFFRWRLFGFFFLGFLGFRSDLCGMQLMVYSIPRGSPCGRPWG